MIFGFSGTSIVSLISERHLEFPRSKVAHHTSIAMLNNFTSARGCYKERENGAIRKVKKEMYTALNSLMGEFVG